MAIAHELRPEPSMKGSTRMNRSTLILAIVGAALAAGCASTNNTQDVGSYDDKTYLTGSRIPVKEKVGGAVAATTDRKAIEDLVRRPGTPGPFSN